MKKVIITITSLILLLCLLTACTPKKEKAEEEKQAIKEETQLDKSPVADFEYSISDDKKGISIDQYTGNLKNVIIPNTVDGFPVIAIGTDAFKGSDIKSITFPDTLISVSSSSFENCVNLEQIDFSNTQLFYIGSYAFKGCGQLKKITFSENLTEIGNRAFYNCSLEELYLPRKLKTIGDGAFYNCSLEIVYIPAELDITDPYTCVFDHNNSLQTVQFERGRESIAGYNFFNFRQCCEVIIPDTVKEFSEYTFTGPAKFVFLGDCPEILDEKGVFPGERIVYYDPDKAGWDTCPWKDYYTLTPIISEVNK